MWNQTFSCKGDQIGYALSHVRAWPIRGRKVLYESRTPTPDQSSNKLCHTQSGHKGFGGPILHTFHTSQIVEDGLSRNKKLPILKEVLVLRKPKHYFQQNLPSEIPLCEGRCPLGAFCTQFTLRPWPISLALKAHQDEK